MISKMINGFKCESNKESKKILSGKNNSSLKKKRKGV